MSTTEETVKTVKDLTRREVGALNQVGLSAALQLADGDASRIEVVSPTELVVR